MNLKCGMMWLLGMFLTAPVRAAEIGRPTPVQPETASAGSLVQVLLALILVVLLIIGMAWLMRRIGGISHTGGGTIRILGGVPVGQRERVVLIQVGGKQLLLGVAPGRVNTLHVLDEPIALQPGSAASESFAERLASALKKGGRP